MSRPRPPAPISAKRTRSFAPRIVAGGKTDEPASTAAPSLTWRMNLLRLSTSNSFDWGRTTENPAPVVPKPCNTPTGIPWPHTSNCRRRCARLAVGDASTAGPMWLPATVVAADILLSRNCHIDVANLRAARLLRRLLPRGRGRGRQGLELILGVGLVRAVDRSGFRKRRFRFGNLFQVQQRKTQPVLVPGVAGVIRLQQGRRGLKVLHRTGIVFLLQVDLP